MLIFLSHNVSMRTGISFLMDLNNLYLYDVYDMCA